MTEQRLLLLKEKIIKTDAVINLLAEKNFKQNQLQAKLQFLFEKFVEKSKEVETLHRKVCICIADHEPLKKRVTELETQYSDLEMRYNKFVNNSELKFQIINKELEALKKRNEELLKTNEELKSQLSTKTTKRNKKNSMREDEIDLLKTENELLSTQVDKLTARCDKESKEIGRLTLLLTETDASNEQVQVDTHLVQTSQLKEKICKLEITEHELKKEVKVLKRERNKLEDQLAELRLEKNLLKESSVDLEEQLNQKLYEQYSKKSMQIDISSLPFIETDISNANIIQVNTHLKEKISKLKLTEEQLKYEIIALKTERNKLDEQLAELRLEKNLLDESTMGLAEQLNHDLHERCNTSDRKLIERFSLPLIETDLSNKNIARVTLHQTETPQYKEILSKSEITEEQLRNEVDRLEKNLLEESNVDLENKIVGIELTQMELFEAEDFEETSDTESVTNLLREMIDLPAILVPFRDDSCSEIEDCLGFASAEVKSCRVCANMVLTTPTKRDDRNTISCQTTSGDFNVSVFSTESHQSNKLVAIKNQSSTNINSKQKQAESPNINQSEEKCTGHRMHKRSRKSIVKKKHLKTDESVLLKRLKLSITQDMLKYMDKYFRRSLKSLKKFDGKCTCKHKSAQFHRNKKLIRRKVEKLRRIKDTSESENESSPAKRNKFKRNGKITREFNPIKSVPHEDELYTSVCNKVIPDYNQITQISNDTETHKRQEDNKLDHNQITCAAARSNHEKSSGFDLHILRKRNDVYSEKTTEFEVISQDSGYARSEADSLELELQNHEKIFVRAADLNNDTSESQRKKNCDRKTIDIKNTHGRRSCSMLERKRKCKEDKTVKELVNSKTLECAISINSLRSPINLIQSNNKELNDADLNVTATCDLYTNNSSSSHQSINHTRVEIASNYSISSEKIDSPDSPEHHVNYDSFKLLSPVEVSTLERTTIYDQVQINPSSPNNTDANMNNKKSSFEFVHMKQLQETGGMPEDTLKRLKDHISSTVDKTKTIHSSFKRPNCAKRMKQTQIVLPEPPVVTTPAPVKKIYKMKNVHARKLFKRLLNFGNESSIVDQVASKFTGQNKEHIASLILSEVCLYTCEKVETKYTPPAPPLTQAQRLLLGFMHKLEMSCMSGLLETFLSAAEKALLVETNLEHLQQITRLYIGVCKFKKDLDRMRRTVCDAFYFMEDFAVPFLFTVLSCWIEVLPLQIHSTDDILVKVLIQVINLKTCKTPGYNLLPLRNLLRVHYEYPTERWNSDEVFREVFNAYLGNPRKSNEYAVLILCKNHSPKWVLQQIDTHIKNVLLNSESVDLKMEIIKTVIRMVSQFHSSKKAVDVTNLKTWLSICLQGGLSRELEDSIRKCINLL